MKNLIAVATMAMVICLGFAGISDAQTAGLQVQGTLGGVDCQTGQVTLNTSGGSTVVQATDQSALYLNGAQIAVCSLAPYAGAAANATLVASGNEFVLGDLNVTTAAAAQPAPVASTGPSALGIALGALAVGAIGYLIGHSTASQPVYVNNSQPYRGYALRCQNNNQWCHR